MRAVEITEAGPSDVLQITERPMPQWSAGQLLIQVQAAGINRPDVLQRLGKYALPAGASDIPGLEVAGVVVDGDLDGSLFNQGDLVCALVQGGGYAEYCVAPIGQCLPLPKGLSALEGASCRKISLPSGAMCSIAAHWPTAKRCWCRAAPPASA